MKYDIFISYKRLDKDKVFSIKDFVEHNTGYKCWIDLDGIESDAQFADIIIKAINNAEVFLFMYSNTHAKIEDYEEDYTVKEITFAQMKKKRIVFVNIDDTPLTDRFYFMFGAKQQVAASSDVAMRKLCSDIKKWLGNDGEKRIEQERIEKNTSNMVNGHEYVDLGLPSGLKWATCNVGANKPEDYGDYFAWGEVKTKSDYSGSSYEFNLGLKYVTLGDISGTKYDSARVNWGGSWRMPTKSELQELNDKCTWVRMSQNGKNGYKVTGPNGSSIFLPAAGFRDGSSLNLAGRYGYYWSSTPKDFDSVNYAYCLDFGSSSHDLSNSDRYDGQSVRPVLE